LLLIDFKQKRKVTNVSLQGSKIAGSAAGMQQAAQAATGERPRARDMARE